MTSGGSLRLGLKFRVGEWTVRPADGRIVRQDQELRLRPMVMDLLVLLSRNPSELVSKDQILDELWGSRFVSESALTRNVAELRRSLGDNARNPRYIETVSKRGYRFIAPVQQGATSESTLAVLLFDNLNPNPDEDYIAEGVADALITELGRIGDLRVTSRQSVLHLKGTRKTVPEIARELKVDALVEGSVLRVGESLRITAQLIAANPEQHLWAESYTCDVADILAVQVQVAHQIAESVHAVLTPLDRARLSRVKAVNPEAHLAYLKAKYCWGRWKKAEIERAFGYIQEAMKADPGYAPAYEILSLSLTVLGYWGHLPAQRAYAQAKKAALTAIELDDSLSSAHVALAFARWLGEWDFENCEAEIQRAIELNPSNEIAHLAYSLYLVTMKGERQHAIEEAGLAERLDPLSPQTGFGIAYILLFAGQYKRALLKSRQTLDLYPEALHAHYVAGCSNLALGCFDEALAAFTEAARISNDALSISFLGHALARAGRRKEAQRYLIELQQRKQREQVPEISQVIVQAGIGNTKPAFEGLEKCYREHDTRLLWLDVVPVFEPLRSDPRYLDLKARLGLPASLSRR